MVQARHFTELIVWQLASELREITLNLTAGQQFSRDLKLRAQTEDAIQSACRNIAEGFGADTHREFARFLRISRRSLNELQDAFRGAILCGYLLEPDLRPVRVVLRRLYPAMRSFIAYLDRTPDERNDAQRTLGGRSDRPTPNRRTRDKRTPPGRP
jgi:four helix bundle protein